MNRFYHPAYVLAELWWGIALVACSATQFRRRYHTPDLTQTAIDCFLKGETP